MLSLRDVSVFCLSWNGLFQQMEMMNDYDARSVGRQLGGIKVFDQKMGGEIRHEINLPGAFRL